MPSDFGCSKGRTCRSPISTVRGWCCTPVEIIPALLFRADVPYVSGRCFSCGEETGRPAFGRCWRCSLAWRLACRRAARSKRDELITTIDALERTDVRRFDRSAIEAKVQEQ